MPTNLKKLIRARMEKTGESWQTASREVRRQAATAGATQADAPRIPSDDSVATYANPKCWAACLGGCSSKISGEHPISRSQFPYGKEITLRGFPWCPEGKVIGLDSAVANILCVTHNNELSPLDFAAKETLRGLQLTSERSNAVITPVHFPRRIFEVSGDHLERWLLKTSINLALLGQPRPKAGIFGADGMPTKRFVEIAFGRSSFDAEEGLTWIATLQEKIEFNQIGTVEFQSISRREDGAFVAAFMRFHGNRLWLATGGAPGIEDGLHPIREWNSNVGVQIKFKWSDRRDQQFRTLPRYRNAPLILNAG
jgi:hypothetical protein